MLTRPSSLTLFLRCEYAWYTRVVLGIESVELPGDRSRGSLFHSLLEVSLRHYADHNVVFAYEGKDGEDMVRAVAAEQYRERGVQVSETEARECLAAVRYQVTRLDLPAWEVMRLADGRPCIELQLESKGWPSDDHGIGHKLDLCMRKRDTQKVWHIDFKSSKANLVKPNRTDRDYQLLFARELLRQHGIAVDGSLLLYLRSKAPTAPVVVNLGKKNEGLSTAADQPCDWPTYETALLARGEDPNDPKYAGDPDTGKLSMRAKLEGNVFAKWVPDVTSPTAERAMVEQLRVSLDRMQQLALGLAIPVRSLGYTCKPGPTSKGCDYNDWCSAGIGKPNGYDLTQIGLRYKPSAASPLAAVPEHPPDPHAAFVTFARQHGLPDHENFQEFIP